MPLATLPAASPKGTPLRVIILAMKSRLQTVLAATTPSLDSSRIIIVADGPWKRATGIGETHVRLRVLGRQGRPGPGAGRLSDNKFRTVAADVITRSGVDESPSDEKALTAYTTDEPTLFGHLAYEDIVLDALDQHTPRSATNVPYTPKPIYETEADDPNRPRPGDGFLAGTIYFMVEYVPSYNLSRT